MMQPWVDILPEVMDTQVKCLPKKKNGWNCSKVRWIC